MHLIAFLISLNFNLTPDFDREIKPFVVRSCVSCHNAESKRGGFRMDSARAILKGGNSGPAVLPGKSSDSLIIHAVTGKENVEQMPPKGAKLSRMKSRSFVAGLIQVPSFPLPKLLLLRK